MDSRSSSLYTSSGSEESMAMKAAFGGRSISRNNSNSSKQPQITNPCNNSNSTNNNQQQTTQTVNQTLLSKKRLTAKNSMRTTSNINNNLVDINSRRTVITLMGGRGYVNWRQPCCISEKSGKTPQHLVGRTEPNNTDAHIVIWELKL